MIVSFGSLATSTPYLGVILFGIVVTWMFAARSLNTQVSIRLHPQIANTLPLR